jgi:glycosyltransferase involved in cell wall biosynthesis
MDFVVDNNLHVSVVMPSFNQSRFVETAVRSVLEQDYPHLELVIVDGGSTDGTLQCLEGFVRSYGAKLRWVSEKDSGPANAINKALGLARGGIIGWLNSDDLYAPQSVSTAVQYFSAHPETVMVYGEGDHIDEAGRLLGRYPVLSPSAWPEACQNGCFICQPAVFLRREVFDAVGLLDESLATAFDFELWLRVFRKFSGRIAFIGRVLACSRRHADCITSRQRRLVAMENMKILGKYFSFAKPHWLQTYVEELYRSYPFGIEPVDLEAHVRTALSEAEEFLEERDVARLKDSLARDARFQFALPGVFTTVYPDGWTPPSLAIRIRGRGCKTISVHCEHRRPEMRPIRLEIRCSWGAEFSMAVEKPGGFEISVPIPDAYAATNLAILISSVDFFVPKDFNADSSDNRQLVFKIVGINYR